ncbi:MAG TPA: DUF3099 domain-containing protein [Terrimesophilobacter sp.]|nr:DUF3099 domain-containing protein [Terrimesophilobacter sp.]HRQ00330.1 DUF3099 domain-containing protein [Terrimesophilobacter sp.]
MAKQPATITSLPPSLADDQRRRMISYTVTMSVRVVCIVLCIVIPGWWALIPAAGAIFLPYFAVVIANAADTRSTRVERPGFILPSRPPVDPPQRGDAS